MIQFDEINSNNASKLLRVNTPKSVFELYSSSYIITEEQKAFYSSNGFVVLRDVVDNEQLNFIRKIMEAAVFIRKGKDERELKDKTPYEQSFLQCGFLCWDFPAVKEFVFAKRFAGIARDLMSANGARLWHDQALFKEAGGRHTDVHQDSSYWPIAEPLKTTTMWLALNDVPEEKGCLYFFPDSHNKQREYVDIFKNPHKPEVIKDIQPVYTPLKAGDATFHSGLTYHGAGSNRTKEMREAMTIIYIADGNKFNANDPRNATHKSCDGLKHNDIINTRYTPRLI